MYHVLPAHGPIQRVVVGGCDQNQITVAPGVNSTVTVGTPAAPVAAPLDPVLFAWLQVKFQQMDARFSAIEGKLGTVFEVAVRSELRTLLSSKYKTDEVIVSNY